MSKGSKKISCTPTIEDLVSKLKNELAKQEVNNEELAEILAKLTDLSIVLDRSSIIVITDHKGFILSVNDTACEISKYSREELIGKTHTMLKSGHHSDDFYRQMWKTIIEGDIWKGEIKNRAKDGTYYWVKTTIFPFLDNAGKPYKFIAVRTDITEGKLFESQLRELLKNDFGQVMRSLDNFVFKLKKITMNDFIFTLIAGKLAKELNFLESVHLHKSIFELLPKDALEKLTKPVVKTFNGESNKFELRLQQKNLFVTLAPLYLGDEIIEIVGSMTDITDLRNSELIVEHMAYHDSLTDLPNRRKLDCDLSQQVAEAKQTYKNVAVLFIDLDHFKHINDTLGHPVGDYILIMAAHRLQKAEFEKIGHYSLYHLGGDEFVFILYDFDENIAKMACDYLLKIFESPFLYKNYDLHLQISMGISLYPLSGDTPEDLLKNADIALFSAKDDGRNTYKFYTTEMNDSLVKKLQIENDLRKALALGNQLQLYYQPQVDMQTNEIVAVEALIRWFHPEKGMIPPLDFIGVAENTGLIIPLGNWVLKEACTQVKKWHNQGFSTLRMSINISTKHFKEPRFIKDMTKVLAETDLAPHLLELEITENSLLDNTTEIGNTLTRIRELGVQIAIDDFGTGFSSLSYLKTFPITTLKIDQSFVYELPANKGDRAIVSSIINLAHNLGLRVIAEGVENKEALAFLQQEKCDEIQGYYFSRPIPANELKSLLEKHCSTD